MPILILIVNFFLDKESEMSGFFIFKKKIYPKNKLFNATNNKKRLIIDVGINFDTRKKTGISKMI